MRIFVLKVTKGIGHFDRTILQQVKFLDKFTQLYVL